MRHLLLAIFVFSATVSFADDDLFSDGQFQEVPMEYDPGFQDNFDGDSGSSNSGGNAQPGLVISDTYGLYSSRDLLRKEKSLSFAGGNDTIASTYHLVLFPQARFEFLKFYGHLGVPLRFPIYDNVDDKSRGWRRHGFVNAGTFIIPRRQDFRSFWDTQKIARHLELNEEGDKFFFRASRVNSVTIGQGELVRNLSPDGLYDHDLMFLTGHVAFDNGRLQGFLGPLLKAQMLGASARITPLYSLDAPSMVRDLNFELAYIGDLNAPNQKLTKDGAYVLDGEQRLVERDAGSAQGFTVGVASEYLATPWLGLKPYVSMGNLWLTGLKISGNEIPTRYGAGVHIGHDATINFFPGTKKSIFVFKTEGRIFSKRYWPGYFGSTYMIDRQVINEPGNKTISEDPLTKSQYLGNHQSNYSRFGYLFEGAYVYNEVISGLVSYENARSFQRGYQIDPMRKLQFVLGFVGLDLIKFHAGYQATSIAQMKEVFDLEKSRALLSLRGQIKLAPFLYFDSWAKHAFGINDMFTPMDEEDDDAMWLSHQAETRSLNFGLGLEFAMTF